jgi:NitT/TauT family transport system ATP-binding protein
MCRGLWQNLMTNILLDINNVSKVWSPGTNRAVTALENINFSVRNQEFAVIIGPSGCGKSTMLYMIAGLEMPTDGEISLDGKIISGTSPDRSLIFQDPSLFPWLSVIDNVEWGLKMRGVPKGERRDRAVHFLQQVGLGDSQKKYPHELSGGMKQRVAIARALCLEPKVLLMDEPFAALDVQTRYKLQNFLLEIWEKTKTTIVFVTHHIDEAINLADWVLVLTARPGRVLEKVDITFPRPRAVGSKEFDEYRSQFFERLRSEVSKAFAEQELAEVIDARIK